MNALLEDPSLKGIPIMHGVGFVRTRRVDSENGIVIVDAIVPNGKLSIAKISIDEYCSSFGKFLPPDEKVLALFKRRNELKAHIEELEYELGDAKSELEDVEKKIQ